MWADLLGATVDTYGVGGAGFSNRTGLNFASYVQAQKDCCAHYGIPVLDQFNIQGINKFNCSLYYLPDNLHLTKEGYRKFGPLQVDFLADGR